LRIRSLEQCFCQKCNKAFKIRITRLTKPVSKSASNNQHLLEQTRNATTNLRRSSLRNEDRHDSTATTDSHTSNNATGVDQGDVVVCSGLHGGSDIEDAAEAHESVQAAPFLVDESRGDGAEEGSGCEERDDVGGDGGVLLVGEAVAAVGEAEVVFEGFHCEDGAHDSGVETWMCSSVGSSSYLSMVLVLGG
jgi:hypothetical protein